MVSRVARAATARPIRTAGTVSTATQALVDGARGLVIVRNLVRCGQRQSLGGFQVVSSPPFVPRLWGGFRRLDRGRLRDPPGQGCWRRRFQGRFHGNQEGRWGKGGCKSAGRGRALRKSPLRSLPKGRASRASTCNPLAVQAMAPIPTSRWNVAAGQRRVSGKRDAPPPRAAASSRLRGGGEWFLLCSSVRVWFNGRTRASQA